jgi:glycosyltransferase involved in cell wall biosynthesis
MEKLNTILLLTDCFNDTTAGAEKQIFELARGLTSSKYAVIIASLDHCSEEIFPKVQALGARLEVFRVKRIYGLSGVIQGIRFFQFLKNEKIDIVQTYHFGSDIWGTVIAKLAGVPVIISNRRDMGFWRKTMHVKAYRLINRWVKKIVVNAGAIKKMIVESEGVSSDKIEVIYNGVEFHESGRHSDISRSSLGLHPQEMVIMHVANLKPVKGHAYLFEALGLILEQVKNVRVFLVGDDMSGGLLQEKVRALGIEKHVTFLGKRQDIASLLEIADVCVLPSLSEGLSNAILEYMVAARPVVTTDVGGNAELVEEGVTGFLVPKGDARALSFALLKLIADKNLRIGMGSKGRQKVIANFSVEGMAQRYENLFDSLLPRKVKILHFISSGGFFGAENVLLNIAQSFNNDNYVSLIAAIRDARSPNVEIIERAKSLGLPTHIFESQGRIDLKTIKELKKYLIENKIDILHTHNYKSDIIGALAAKDTGIALISTAHGFTDMNSKVSWYERLDQWFLKKYFKRTIVVTDQMLRNFPSDKRRIISNGINIKKFETAAHDRERIRREYGIADADLLIGTVGRLSVEKNQALFLSALLGILQEHRHVKVMIIGDGPEGDALKGFVKASGLEQKVLFTGLISDPAPFYQAFDIFVLSSLTEGVPLTLLEAMASKVPVVATKVGGIPQIISDGVTGLLVESQNASQLREAISTLICDSSKRERFKEAAFNFAKENYSLDRMNWLYHEVYQEVLNP